MTMHSHSNGRDLPELPFQFCLPGPYSAAAAAAETHPFRTPPPPPPAAKTKSASSAGHQRLPPRDSPSFEFRLAGPSYAAAAVETLHLHTPPPHPAAKTKTFSSGYQKLPPQRMPPRLGWRALLFGLVRVPAEMEMHDIRKRQRRRRQRWNSAEESAVPPPRQECGGVGHGPWKLIRSLSCRGFESTAVVATATPLSFI